jgi:SAM-dependent methyltransferase
MDLETLAWLQSPPGKALLAELAGRPLAEADVLGELTRLRRSYTADEARAAVDLALLRRRAAAKFPAAARMFFTREALEQASAAPVAAHRAGRLFTYALVADLCCGAGGDALALAAAGAEVIAVDRDELRLALAAANAAALGLSARISFARRDLLAEAPPAAEAIFCDPGRRAGGRRRFHVNEYEPPLAHILAWRAHTPALAVKLSPGVELAELPVDGVEREFVSLDGELKEAALWCGPLAQACRRACLLRTDGAGQTQTYTMYSDQHTSPSSLILPPSSFLYEPDPAVIRAGLVADLAGRIGAAQIDPQIAYLTSAGHTPTPFARVWPVIAWQPFGLKRLRASLRELGAGPVTVKKRGSPLDTDALARQLSGDGPRPLVVVLTQHLGRPISIICGPPVVQ